MTSIAGHHANHSRPSLRYQVCSLIVIETSYLTFFKAFSLITRARNKLRAHTYHINF